MPDISCSRLLKRLGIVSFSIPPHLAFSAGTRSMRSNVESSEEVPPISAAYHSQGILALCINPLQISALTHAPFIQRRVIRREKGQAVEATRKSRLAAPKERKA